MILIGMTPTVTRQRRHHHAERLNKTPRTAYITAPRHVSGTRQHDHRSVPATGELDPSHSRSEVRFRQGN